MRPVVSSLVAIAIALAPLTALAKPHKTAHAKVIKHPKADAAEGAQQADTSEGSEQPKDKVAKTDPKAHITQVKAGHAGHASKKSVLKPVLHHAHNVDLGGAGHKEPKVDHKGAIIPASMVVPSSRDKAHAPAAHVKAKPAKTDLPKLPNPSAGKPSKGGSEKGARKPSQKSEAADSSDGQPERDEEFADLVARIRGGESAPAVAPKAETPKAEAATATAKGETSKAKLPASSGAPTPIRPAATPCVKEPVEIVRGPEVERFTLTNCDGTPAPYALEHLSILIRPGGIARPVAPPEELAKRSGPDVAHGIRRVDPRLVGRVQALVDHFGKSGAPAKLFVISGYRPASVGSMHSTGRAIDFRVDGVRNEDVVAFCKSMTDTGCGYYPNSSFVHIDVRDAGAGHVTWIDASGPGETPRYVRSWPPPASQARPVDRVSTQSLEDEGVQLMRAQRPLDRESAPEPTDDHPAEVAP